MRHVILAGALALALPTAGVAGQIERACNGSNRAEASPQLCGCIQQAADLTLTPRDQSRAAKFFRNPHQAQEVRQSGRATDEAFWERYQAFGETAAVFCGGA